MQIYDALITFLLLGWFFYIPVLIVIFSSVEKDFLRANKKLIWGFFAIIFIVDPKLMTLVFFIVIVPIMIKIFGQRHIYAINKNYYRLFLLLCFLGPMGFAAISDYLSFLPNSFLDAEFYYQFL